MSAVEPIIPDRDSPAPPENGKPDFTPRNEDTHVLIRGLSKRFGSATLYSNFDIDFRRGHITTIFGPNGCGKSTLINMVAGLLPMDAGAVRFDGKVLAETTIGYVFQNYRDALFPWMTARQNIEYPLRILRQSKADRARRVKELVEALEISFASSCTLTTSPAGNSSWSPSCSLEPIGSIADNIDDVRKAENMPVAKHIADPFYSGAAVLTRTFIEERPEVARKVVEVLDEATRLANENFDEYRSVIAEYTAVTDAQAEFVAQPYLRGWTELNETDIASYQAFVDVFHQHGVLEDAMNVEDLILTEDDFE